MGTTFPVGYSWIFLDAVFLPQCPQKLTTLTLINLPVT